MPTQNEKIRAVLMAKNITIGALSSQVRSLKIQVEDLKLSNESLRKLANEHWLEIKKLKGEI